MLLMRSLNALNDYEPKPSEPASSGTRSCGHTPRVASAARCEAKKDVGCEFAE